MSETVAICKTSDEVEAALGQRCTVVGIYELEEFKDKKGQPWRTWPVLKLVDGRRHVLVDSIWDDSKQPSAETIERYRGKQVEVTGQIHASPPGRRANMAALTISPVEAVRVVGE